jgi:hypothetical protein
MAKYILRQVKDEDDTYWIIYESGFFSEPELVLSENEMKSLVDQYNRRKG